MNYQQHPLEYVKKILKEKGVQYCDLAYYAWPSVFGSTSGPCGCIGGQSMSTFTVEAWVCDDSGPTVFTCCGMYHFDNNRFEPFRTIKNWHKIPDFSERTAP